jgi:beta-galactosidase
MADVVNRNQSLFLNATPAEAKIGIVYNPLTQMVGGMQRRDYPGALSQSLIGYYQTYANHNIPVDFIHREHIENQDIAQYKLIIIPYPIMFTQEAAAGLRAYIENGGHVLAEARIGWNDDRGYASEIIPGMGMHDIFGVRENEIRMRDEINFILTDENHPAIQGFEKGSKLTGSLYNQSLSILGNSDVKILATNEQEQPTIVSTQYGKGESMLVGTYMGMANFQNFNKDNDRFFVNLLDWAKIKKPFTTSVDVRTSDQVEVRLQNTPDGYIVFAINHSSANEDVNIDLIVNLDGVYTLRDVINDTQVEVKSKGNILTIEMRVESKNVRVIEIKR